MLLLGGCYDSHSTSPTRPFAEHANIEIGGLRRLCESGYCNISSDMVCVGRITSSDREGNFYRSMVVEDVTGAVEVRLGTYNIASQYPVGTIVALRLKGTAIMVEDGVVQVGLPPQSFDNEPREFEAQEIIDRHIVRDTSREEVEPMLSAIQSIDVTHCGRFVRVEGVQHTPFVDSEEDEYYRFTDIVGNQIFVEISEHSDFATLDLPSVATSIQGILYHKTIGGDVELQFVIKPRFADDISTLGYNW